MLFLLLIFVFCLQVRFTSSSTIYKQGKVKGHANNVSGKAVFALKHSAILLFVPSSDCHAAQHLHFTSITILSMLLMQELITIFILSPLHWWSLRHLTNNMDSFTIRVSTHRQTLFPVTCWEPFFLFLFILLCRAYSGISFLRVWQMACLLLMKTYLH